MYKWKDDMKHPGYKLELICAHTISGQGTADSTFDYSATTPLSQFYSENFTTANIYFI